MEELSFTRTKCPLCDHDCRNSRMLPCLHSFCLDCLAAKYKDKVPSEKDRCPACATSFTLPTGGVSALPQNFIIDNLLQLTNCSHCKQVLTDPRTLPCVHTFCLQCIKSLFPDLNPGNRSECPECQTEFIMPDTGHLGLPKNALVECLVRIREPGPGSCGDVESSFNGALEDGVASNQLNISNHSNTSLTSSSVDIYKAIRPYYAKFIDCVDPVQMVDLLAEYLTNQDMDLIHVKTRNEGRAAGARTLVNVMNGRVPVSTLVYHLCKLKLKELADLIIQNELESTKPASNQGNISLRYTVLSHFDNLADICVQRCLKDPECKPLGQDKDGYKMEVSVTFGFSSKQDHPSKKDAEESAARAALDILDAGNSFRKSNIKGSLNELCQKEAKYGMPTYQTFPDSVGPYYSTVYVKIVGVSGKCPNENEAKEQAARDILNMLHLAPHLSKLLSNTRFTETEFHVQGAAGEYQATMSTRFQFEPDREECAGYDKPKDAEKHAARRVLSLLYPEVDASDVNKVKNLLQEKNPSRVPTYEEVRLNEKYLSRVAVTFMTTDKAYHQHVYQAKDAVVRNAFQRLRIDVESH